MLRERPAAFLAQAGQHVQHAGRQEFLADFGHQQHAERRILGRLHHQRVAGAQSGRDLQRAQQHRRVPRDDGADDAERLAARVAQHVLAERNGLAFQLAAKPAEIAEDIGGHLGLRPRLGAQRVAGFQRDGARQLLDARLHRLGDPHQHAAALARRHARPGWESFGAAFTARSTSSARPRGTSAIGVRCAGSSTAKVSPEAASTHLPPISICALRKAGLSVRAFVTAVMIVSLRSSLKYPSVPARPPSNKARAFCRAPTAPHAARRGRRSCGPRRDASSSMRSAGPAKITRVIADHGAAAQRGKTDIAGAARAGHAVAAARRMLPPD